MGNYLTSVLGNKQLNKQISQQCCVCLKLLDIYCLVDVILPRSEELKNDIAQVILPQGQRLTLRDVNVGDFGVFFDAQRKNDQ